MEFVIKRLPTKIAPEPDGFPDEFLQISEEEIIQILHKFFQTIEEEANFPTHSMRPA